MKARLLVAVILVILGVGLSLAAVSSHGLPWGFQDRAAIVVRHVGGVEVFASRRGDSEPTVLPVAFGTGLLAGDEVRVGALSEAGLRFPTAEVTLADGARARVDDHALVVSRGSGGAVVRAAPFRLDTDALGISLALDPGEFRFLGNGRDTLALAVVDGHARLPTGEEVAPGKLIVVKKGAAPSVVDAPAAPRCRVRCRIVGTGNAIAEGEIPPYAMAWVNGAITAGDPQGRFSVPVPLDGDEGQATLFVRDVAAQTCLVDARCAP